MAKITFLVVDECLLSSINSLIDTFSIANRWHQVISPKEQSPLFQMEIVTPSNQEVQTNGGFKISPDQALEEVKETDILILPALIKMDRPFVANQDRLFNWIRNLYRSKTKIVAVCTGVFILAETGLLNGKIATTNWQFSKLFQRRYPQVQLKINEILTEEEGLICTGASSAVLNLGMYLIQVYGSDELVSCCSKSLLIDLNRESQAPYILFDSSKNHGDVDIAKAQRWMESNFSRSLTMDSVAKHVNISSRHFKRRFKKATGESPLLYLQKIRTDAAKKKLETTLDTVTQITYQVGYEDSSTFRRLFKKHVGISPREYRDKFFIPEYSSSKGKKTALDR